jgi:hypothetical protein
MKKLYDADTAWLSTERKRSKAFPARFPDAVCPVCKLEITVGVMIRHAYKGYAHDACLSSSPSRRRVVPYIDSRQLPKPLAAGTPKTVRWVDLLGREHVSS